MADPLYTTQIQTPTGTTPKQSALTGAPVTSTTSPTTTPTTGPVPDVGLAPVPKDNFTQQPWTPPANQTVEMLPGPGESLPGADTPLPTAPASTTNLQPISYTPPSSAPAAPKASQGLIDSAMNYDFRGAAGEMQGPTTLTQDGGALVENRLNTLIDKGGEYMARAGARGAARANARGLINSSMGVEAGQAAAIDAALPIAQQDANTVAGANQFNANAANSFASEGNAFGRQGALAKFGVISGLAQQKDQQEFQTGEREGAQAYGTSERLGSQAYGTSEREGSQAFTDAQRVASQLYGTSERVGAQQFQSGENQLNRNFTAAERQAAQAFSSSERVASQAWEANQNQLSREFQARTQAEQTKLAEAARNSEAGMRFVAAYYDNVNQILRDPNLDPEVKQAQITKALENTKAALTFLNLSDQFDLSALLNFG